MRLVARGRGAEAELLELPDGLVLSGEGEEQLRALEGRVERPACQRLVPEELERGEAEDRLVDRPDAPAPQDVLERLAQDRLAFLFLGRCDVDRLAQRAVHEPLDAHLGVGADDRVPDEDADPLVDAGAERLVERPAQRLLDLPRLALQPRERVVARLEAREDVEVRAARPVDGDEVLGREDRAEHPPERLARSRAGGRRRPPSRRPPRCGCTARRPRRGRRGRGCRGAGPAGRR